MADAAIGLLVSTAQILVTHYSNLISGEKEQLYGLTKELNQLKALMEDASRDRNTQSRSFQEWLRHIREVVLHVEDTLAYCYTQAAAESASSNWLYRFINGKKVTLAEQVITLREKRVQPALAYLKDQMSRPDDISIITPTPESSVRTIPELTTNITRKESEYITLRGEEMKKLVDQLNGESEGSQKFQVVAIEGMAGLGKTTLALKIYQDMRMRGEFNVIWVTVSQNLNKTEVLLTILEELKDEEDHSGRTFEELSDKVRIRLEEKKFLIFFDDVWEKSHWDEIENLLPREGHKNGKVVITTRHLDLAKYASTETPHRLKFLEKHESWELLRLSIFGNRDFPPRLTEIGEKIRKKCGGVPFAIVVIGGVLRNILRTTEGTMETKEEWETVLNNLGDYLNIKHKDGLKGFGQVMSMSYQSLSQELKECFLYLGIFPEDTEIPVWKLSQLWIAEGFIHQKDQRSLEETAQLYVKELIHKNLLIVVKKNPSGNAKTCRVHDLIRNFCLKEASSLYREIRLSGGRFVPGDDDIVDCRRICIHSSVKEYLKTEPNIQNARSFLSFSKKSVDWGDKEKPAITAPFRVLRVLDVSMAIKFHKFPDELTRLVLLKYVTISGVQVDVLPDNIHKLWNVQTLEVYTSSSTLKVNANIWKMKHLRHFKTKASIILSKGGKHLRGKANLLTLYMLSPKSCNDKVFSKTENLISLGIRGELSILADSTCLEKLEKLQKLKLVNNLSDQMHEQKPLLHFPDRFPPNIKILVLSATQMKWEQFSTLCQLAELKELKLKNNAFKGDRWNATDETHCFPKLESLVISKTDLISWAASSKNFPSLTDLILKNCMKLRELPEDLVTNLEVLHMDMETVNKHVIDTAKNLEKATQKSRRDHIDEKCRFKLVAV